MIHHRIIPRCSQRIAERSVVAARLQRCNLDCISAILSLSRLPLRAGDLSVFEHNSPHASRRKVCHVPVPPLRLRLCARQCGARKNRSTMICPRRLRDTPPNSGRPWRMKPAVYIDLSFFFSLFIARYYFAERVWPHSRQTELCVSKRSRE